MQGEKKKLQIEVEIPVHSSLESYYRDNPLEGEESEEFVSNFVEAHGKYQAREAREALEEGFEGAEIDVRYDVIPMEFGRPRASISVQCDAWDADRRGSREEWDAVYEEVRDIVERVMDDSWDGVIREGFPDA